MLLRNRVLTTLVFIFLILNLKAQPCPDGPPGGDFCAFAPLMGCNLDGYVGSNSGFTEGETPSDFFCGLIENNQFFKFVASEDTIFIQIIPSNCIGSLGLQAALFETDDCVNFNNISLCASLGFESTLNLLSYDAPAGQEIYLMIDGFNGDVCDFNIVVHRGVELAVEEDVDDIDLCAMTVDVGFNFLRRCFSNKVVVKYCNQTTTEQEDVIIDIKMDEDLDFKASSIPLIDQIEEQLYFDVGYLDVGECGNFQMEVVPNCETAVLGQVHCIAARIFPDTLCDNQNEDWSGASVALEASCTAGLTSWSITNTGDSPTTENLSYIVIKDDDLVIKSGQFTLEAGEEMIFENSVTNGSVLKIVVEQEPFHPGGNLVIATAACGNPFFDSISEVFGLTHNPYEDAICAKNIGSYDPNDKAAVPSGTGPEHHIAATQNLEYKIRFQNTGTDTAFTVVVRDTITADLDMSTLEEGVSSHIYDLTIEEENILVFTFNNILLPDSTTNLIESNGFFEYSLSPVLDILPETKIENSASIYFDFNDPIHTNTVFHTIEKPVAYAIMSVDVCANEMYNSVQYDRDTSLSELFETPFLDSFFITNINVLPTDFEVQEYTVPYGTYINNEQLTADTTYYQYWTNSFGCDSVLIQNYTVESSNATNLLEDTEWSVYPNPASNQLWISTIQAFNSNDYRVKLTSILGSTLMDEMRSIQPGQASSISVKDFPPGTYLLSISSEHGMITEKVVIQP